MHVSQLMAQCEKKTMWRCSCRRRLSWHLVLNYGSAPMLKYKGGFVKCRSRNMSSRERNRLLNGLGLNLQDRQLWFPLDVKATQSVRPMLDFIPSDIYLYFSARLRYVPVRFCGSLSACLTIMSHKLDVYNNVKTSLSVFMTPRLGCSPQSCFKPSLICKFEDLNV